MGNPLVDNQRSSDRAWTSCASDAASSGGSTTPRRPAALGRRDGRRAGRTDPAGSGRRRCTRGDTGYPWAATTRRRSPSFAAERWDWKPDPGDDADRPRRDARRGRGAQAAHRTRRRRRGQLAPSTRRSSHFVTHLDRRVVEAPLGAAGRHRPRVSWSRPSTEAAPRWRPRGIPDVQPAEPDRHGAHCPRSSPPRSSWRRRFGVRVVADEIHAPVVRRRRDVHVGRLAARGSRAISLMSASKAFNLAGLKAAMAVPGPTPPPTWRGCPRRCRTARATSA